MYSPPFEIRNNNFRIKSGAQLLRNLTEFRLLVTGDETCRAMQDTCHISIMFLHFRKSVPDNGNTIKISIHAQKGSKTYSSTL